MPTRYFLVFVCAATIFAAAVSAGEDKAADPIGAAVAEMRHIAPKDFEKKNAKGMPAKAVALGNAWKTLSAGKAEATKALHKEIDTVLADKEEDYFFLLGAAALLYQMNGLDEADVIAKCWDYSRDHLNMNGIYTFETAARAAFTRDPRAIPLMMFFLNDRTIFHFVPDHYLEIKWPLTLAFTWNAFGTGCEKAFLDVLADPGASSDALCSAIFLASNFQSLAGLEQLRKLVDHKDGEVRLHAAWTIGKFGHPDDFELIAKRLRDAPDAKAFDPWMRAAADYGDLRLAETMMSRIDGAEGTLLAYLCAGLLTLPTQAGLQKVGDVLADPKSPLLAEKALFNHIEKMHKRLTDEVAKIAGAEWKNFPDLDEKKRREAFETLWAQGGKDEVYRLKPDDRRLTRKDFLEAVDEWTKRGKITGGTYEWVEDRHVMDVATPDDIPVLIDLRGALYRRMSDECLYEAAILDKLLDRLGRERYRTVYGICDKVEAP